VSSRTACVSTITSVSQGVEFLVERLDLELGLDVDLIVLLGGLAVDVLLAVLAHHDERRGVGRLERQSEVQQDEGVGVPRAHPGGDVEDDPDEQHGRLDEDERPRAHRRRHRVGDPLAERQAGLGRIQPVGLAGLAAQLAQLAEQRRLDPVEALAEARSRSHACPDHYRPISRKAYSLVVARLA
jgi:hypothetical protein